MIVQTLTDELRQEILTEYLSGSSILGVEQAFPWLKKRMIREALGRHIRPKNTQRVSDPSLDEIEERKELVKAGWTAEQASRKWVGRYATQAESRGCFLSSQLREMGVEE